MWSLLMADILHQAITQLPAHTQIRSHSTSKSPKNRYLENAENGCETTNNASPEGISDPNTISGQSASKTMSPTVQMPIQQF